MKKETLTTREAAEYIERSERQLLEYKRLGLIGFIQYQPRGPVSFTREELDRFIEERRTKATPPKIDLKSVSEKKKTVPKVRSTVHERDKAELFAELGLSAK